MAFIMTGITEGRTGIGRLLRRLVLWRVGLRWHLFALIGLPLILLLSAIVLPGALASFQGLTPTIVLGYPLIFAYVILLGGGLNEETGWRGFALPRLQRLHGPLVGSLILGPVWWAFWHLPLFFIPSWDTPPTMLNIVLFLISCTFIAIILTWLFNNTQGSVLLAILAHSSINTTYATLAVLFSASIVTGHGGLVPFVIGFGVVALLLVALTRGRLGYQHYRQEEPDSAVLTKGESHS
jgi:membrane protease YdiL (CAAX protease family)